MRYRPAIMAAVLALASCQLSLTAPPLPVLPPPAGAVFESGNHASEPAARERWDPQDKSEPVSLATVGGRRVLRMPCPFQDKPGQRFSWDLPVRLNLALDSGVQFQFHCADASPVSGFSFYLRSGGGWYAARFEHTRPEGWTHVRILKPDTTVEGAVAGWGAIDRIRISAWRGADVNTAFHVADLAPIRHVSPVALVRAESILASPRQAAASSVFSASSLVSDHFRRLGLSPVCLSDLDLSGAIIRDLRLLILPFNPEMPPSASEAISSFLKSGGNLMTFYQVPADLQPLMGIRFGRHISQSYAGHFATIRPAPGSPIDGLPPLTRQLSWNILQAHPIEGRSATAALWHSDTGDSTGEPAIVVSAQAVHLTHVAISDDPAAKQVMLLAMAGHFVPGLWREAAESALGGIGRLGPYSSAPQAERALLGQSQAAPVAAMIRRSSEWRADAEALLGRSRFPDALRSATQSQLELIRAYSAVRRAPAGEFRGAWCHNAFGVEGMTWDRAVRILAENGFTAVLPNMAWGGIAYYSSSVLPVSRLVAEKGDPLALCAAACRKYGIECHVWKVCWNLSDRAPADFTARLKQENRVQVNFSGTTQERWLCPSHPLNQKLEVDAVVEIARRYDIAGIHLDYIRYPGSDSCFCDGCRARFQKSAGVSIADWPRALRTDPALARLWLQFRRETITHTVAAVRAALKQARPGCRLSAAVFMNWPLDRDNVGQDWKLWCDRGLLDFICPMNYTDNNLRFEQMLARQREWAGQTPCYPGIGISTWPDRGNPIRLIDQIDISRRLGAGGFTLFQYRESEAREVLPVCGLGATKPDTKPAAKGVPARSP